jgi:putative tryptophan/tyrosine transport system substrate-binding protein
VDRRRFLLTSLAGAFAAPLAVQAQPTARLRRIGFLRSGRPPSAWVEAFQQGLRELGYIEGKHFVLDLRFTEASGGELRHLAAELVRLNVDVIVGSGTPATLAAKEASGTVPIVFVTVNDPVGTGLVKQLSRPGGNITGLTNQTPDLGMKRVQLLKEVIPQLARLAVLGNPTHPAYASQVKEIEAGVRALGGQVEAIPVREPNEFETAFKSARSAQALLQLDDVLLTTHRARLLELTVQHRLPAVYGFREFVDGGGLMSYGVNFPDMYRRGARYVDKILNGAKPADLPIEQPTKFELVINLKTARALGLTIPPSLLLRADQVIE